MDDKFYRDLIDRVSTANHLYFKMLYNEYNKEDIQEPPADGFEDFSKLWNIINDQDLNVSDETYFNAVSKCLATFYGERQDPIPVWNNIVKRYKEAIQNPERIESFNKTFKDFLEKGDGGLIPTLDLFYELMHIAIGTKNLDMSSTILWLTPTEIQCWGQLEEVYENDPEWAAYLECLSDITYDRLPNDPEFKETIKELYSAFGNLPNMEKLNNLYHRYFNEDGEPIKAEPVQDRKSPWNIVRKLFKK